LQQRKIRKIQKKLDLKICVFLIDMIIKATKTIKTIAQTKLILSDLF
jgi:hypothetical protein